MKGSSMLLIALLVGGLLALQGMVNGQLGKSLAHPLQASLVSFSVGILCIFALLIVLGVKLPSQEVLSEVPWYLYTGGLLGIIYVTTVLTLIPRIGVANVLLAIFVGQMFVSMAADHFGWLNTPINSMTLTRAGGCLLLIAGLYLVQLRA